MKEEFWEKIKIYTSNSYINEFFILKNHSNILNKYIKRVSIS